MLPFYLKHILQFLNQNLKNSIFLSFNSKHFKYNFSFIMYNLITLRKKYIEKNTKKKPERQYALKLQCILWLSNYLLNKNYIILLTVNKHIRRPLMFLKEAHILYLKDAWYFVSHCYSDLLCIYIKNLYVFISQNEIYRYW